MKLMMIKKMKMIQITFDLDEHDNEQDFDDDEEEYESDSFGNLALGFHLAGALEYLKDPSKYMPGIDDDDDDDADDNETALGCYYWQERCEINNIGEIIDQIRYEESKKRKNQNAQKSKTNKNEILGNIEHEFIQAYASNPQNKANKTKFINNYIEKNTNELTMTHEIKKYKQINNIDMKKSILSFSSLQRKTKEFDDKSLLEKEDYLRNGPFPYKKGGSREGSIKVTDDTIKCIITLIIDFPTLSANSIAMYLNSPLGQIMIIQFLKEQYKNNY